MSVNLPEHNIQRRKCNTDIHSKNHRYTSMNLSLRYENHKDLVSIGTKEYVCSSACLIFNKYTNIYTMYYILIDYFVYSP